MLSMSNAARAEAPANIPTIEVYDRMRIAARWGGVRLPDMAEYLDVRPETIRGPRCFHTESLRGVLIA